MSEDDGDWEVYTVDVDGTDLIQLTDNSSIDWFPSWSPDGAKIAFASDRDGNMEIYLMDSDGDGQLRLTDHPGYDYLPDWSPDGRLILFSSDRYETYTSPECVLNFICNMELLTITPEGGGLERLTFTLAGEEGGTWAPDGRRIAFSSNRTGAWNLYLMDPSGGSVRNLTDDPVDSIDPAWSPDGRTLAFGRDSTIWLMDVSSGQEQETGLSGRAPSWSRDGRRLAMAADGIVIVALDVIGLSAPAAEPASPPSGRVAFASNRDGDFEIFVLDVSGTGVNQLTHNSDDDRDPAWDPWSDALAFASDRGGNFDIYTIHADGTGLRRVTDHAADDRAPAFSPEGDVIAFVSTRTGNEDIYLVSTDPLLTNVVQLTDHPAADSSPAWAPDSFRIAFSSTMSGGGDLYVVDRDGGGLLRLTDDPATDAAPAWSPDGQRIVFMSQQDGNWELYLLDLETDGLTRLTDHPAADQYPSWSPSGIVFMSARTGNFELYHLDPETLSLTRLTEDPGVDGYPTVRRDTHIVATAPAAESRTPSVTATGQPAAAPRFQDGQEIKITNIKMVTATDGWAVSGPFILRTRDGGQSWREVTPADPSLSSRTEAYGAFLDRENAWIVFGSRGQIPTSTVIWRTSDGGNTWSPSGEILQGAIGDQMWAELYAVDSANVWVAFRGFYAGAGPHYSAHFFRTTDGGKSWEHLEADVGVDYTGMAFADRDVGWLTWQTTGPYAAAPPEYAVTADGGLTWDVRTLPPPDAEPALFEDYEYSEVYRPNLLSAASVRVLVASWWHLESGQLDRFTGYLYATENGGQDWDAHRLPGDVLASDYELFFLDPTNAVVLGRQMYQTNDGGETWVHIKTVSWDGQFSFVSPTYGWAVARSGDDIALLRTFDGGRTWAALQPRAIR